MSEPHASGAAGGALAPGSLLGPYRVDALLGAGGMGEVYRAVDTRLDRQVALKVLHAGAEGGGDARVRFQREARSIAQLQHPHVCTVHDVGVEGERDYLVMELLAGETLAARLARGPLPLAEVFAVGAQIAGALAAAHRQGILHRDLKPANVMLTRSGTKLLDFGLAKVAAGLDPAAPLAAATRAQTEVLTAEGALVGTLAYMAPEQLQGRAIDARADLWALGCVLYEMATGRRAFAADSAASTIAAILERQPPSLPELQPLSPPAFDRLVGACLAKDPDARWQSAADLERELRWLAAGDGAAAGTGARERRGRGRRKLAAAALVALLLAAVGAAAYWLGRRAAPAPARPVLSVLPFAGKVLDPLSMVPQISPDGRRVVVGAAGSWAGEALWLLSLDSVEPQPIPGTEGGYLPFWSPDGRSIGFFARRELKRLDLGGGAPLTLCSVPDQGRGGSWSADGTILFSPGRTGGLLRVDAGGGTPQPATTLDGERGEVTHRWPQFLPDGQGFLYWASSNRRAGGFEPAVRLGRLGRTAPGELLLPKASNAVYSAGHLLFDLEDGSATLWAQPFDARRGVLHGPPRRLVEVNTDAVGMSLLRISATPGGDLVYLGMAGQWSTDQAWFDLQGERVGTLVGGAPWFAPRFSPDGKHAAVSMTNLQDGDTHLWIVDTAEGGSPRRLTFEKGDVYSATWSPDGRRVAYAAEREEQSGIYGRAAAGGPEELLLESNDLDEGELDWSPDGRHLLFQVWNAPAGNYDMHLLDVAARAAQPWLATAADERVARWSRDGAFVAYSSNESGALEVYLRRLDGNGKWQVSDGGGSMPRWSAGGSELYYLRPDGRLAVVAVTLGAEVALGRPRLLFDRQLPVTRWLTYEPHPDGKRLLIDYPPPETLDVPVRLLQSWPALLER